MRPSSTPGSLSAPQEDLTLTANGLLFESRARELVKIYEEIRDELRQAENEYTGLIRFGCVESSVVEFVIDVFTELMQH